MKVQPKLLVAAALSVFLILMLAYLYGGTPAPRSAHAAPAAQPAPLRWAGARPAPATQPAPAPRREAAPVRESYIVQAASASEARGAVVRAGGKVTRELSVIRAVDALLDDEELAVLRDAQVPRLRYIPDAGRGELRRRERSRRPTTRARSMRRSCRWVASQGPA